MTPTTQQRADQLVPAGLKDGLAEILSCEWRDFRPELQHTPFPPGALPLLPRPPQPAPGDPSPTAAQFGKTADPLHQLPHPIGRPGLAGSMVTPSAAAANARSACVSSQHGIEVGADLRMGAARREGMDSLGVRVDRVETQAGRSGQRRGRFGRGEGAGSAKCNLMPGGSSLMRPPQALACLRTGQHATLTLDRSWKEVKLMQVLTSPFFVVSNCFAESSAADWASAR